jgi:hypothetical protein
LTPTTVDRLVAGGRLARVGDNLYVHPDDELLRVARRGRIRLRSSPRQSPSGPAHRHSAAPVDVMSRQFDGLGVDSRATQG